MKILLVGGSGLIGRKLINQLLHNKYELILLTRKPEKTKNEFPTVQVKFWNAKTSNELRTVIETADAIINLTGESIASKRWTLNQKQRILTSRIESTRAIVDAIKQAKHKPSVLINASATGYYGNVPEGDVTENSPRGIGFLADVCEQWEAEALKAKEIGVRVVLLRTGIVLDKNGGALQKLLLPFKLFVGGPLGSGDQWFPWIHLQDEVNAIIFALENKNIEGAINLASAQSVRMKEFAKALGKVLHRPSIFSVPGFVLKAMLGEMAGPLLLDGQKVIPRKLLDAGFKFQFPELDGALRDVLR